jgi:hypothetical protein
MKGESENFPKARRARRDVRRRRARESSDAASSSRRELLAGLHRWFAARQTPPILEVAMRPPTVFPPESDAHPCRLEVCLSCVDAIKGTARASWLTVAHADGENILSAVFNLESGEIVEVNSPHERICFVARHCFGHPVAPVETRQRTAQSLDDFLGDVSREAGLPQFTIRPVGRN